MSSLPYRYFLNKELCPRPIQSSPIAIELFAGCGGLGLGFTTMGFRTIGYEMNPDACNTYQANLGNDCVLATLTSNSKVAAGDVLLLSSHWDWDSGLYPRANQKAL